MKVYIVLTLWYLAMAVAFLCFVFCIVLLDYDRGPYKYDTKLDTVQISHQTEWDGSLHRNKDSTWMIYHRLMPLENGTVIDFGPLLGVWQVNKVWKNNGIHTHFCRSVKLKVVNYLGNNSSEDENEVTE